jgi:hypothetical protein
MHKNYVEFIHAYYYLIIVAYFVNLFEILKNNIICYQSVYVNRIGRIPLSRSREHSLGSYYRRNGEVKRAKGGVV